MYGYGCYLKSIVQRTINKNGTVIGPTTSKDKTYLKTIQ